MICYPANQQLLIQLEWLGFSLAASGCQTTSNPSCDRSDLSQTPHAHESNDVKRLDLGHPRQVSHPTVYPDTFGQLLNKSLRIR